MIKAVLLFIVGLIFLIKGGDWFVDGATGIAERFHVPELLIGATVVSIGTTLPEVMVSATSAAKGYGSMAYGNAIGSIICNTALIAAITVAVAPAVVERKTLKMPLLFFFGSAAIYAVVSYTTGFFSRPVGVIFLVVFAGYMFILIRQAVAESKKTLASAGAGTEASQEGEEKPAPLWKELLLLVIGAALIAVGARLLVDNGTIIAEGMGVPQSVVALTFVALGTSLPELVTAIVSLAKGHGSLSLGNIIGANLFNLVLVSGVSITVNPFEVPAQKLIGGMNAALLVDIPVMLFVMLFLTVPALITGKLKRYQGIVLLMIYFGYMAFQFVG